MYSQRTGRITCSSGESHYHPQKSFNFFRRLCTILCFSCEICHLGSQKHDGASSNKNLRTFGDRHADLVLAEWHKSGDIFITLTSVGQMYIWSDHLHETWSFLLTCLSSTQGQAMVIITYVHVSAELPLFTKVQLRLGLPLPSTCNPEATFPEC